MDERERVRVRGREREKVPNQIAMEVEPILTEQNKEVVKQFVSSCIHKTSRV